MLRNVSGNAAESPQISADMFRKFAKEFIDKFTKKFTKKVHQKFISSSFLGDGPEGSAILEGGGRLERRSARPRVNLRFGMRFVAPEVGEA